MCDYDDSSSDDDGGMLKRALDVSLPDNFDPNIIPQSGEEYLQLVMYEAKRCKKMVYVNVDSSKLKEPTIKFDVMENCIKAPEDMLPTAQWQQEKLKDFINLRKFLEPKIKENPDTYAIQDQHWSERIVTEIPKFSTISCLSQGSKIRLLQIILDHMDTIKSGQTISYETGVWLYGIMATLGTPLGPHQYHCLRELARKCSKIRSSLPEKCSAEKYITLNLFICIVAKYFNQFDLSD